jgi:hypothetical protein
LDSPDRSFIQEAPALKSARTLLPSTILAAAAALVFTASARAGAWLPAPGEHYTEIRAGIAASNEWYDLDGTRQGLVGGGRLDATQASFLAELGWKKGRSFFMSVPLASVHRHVEDPAGYSGTETGLSDMTVGVRFKIRQAASAMSVDVGWITPMGYTNDYALRDASGRKYDVAGALGDGATPQAAQYPATLGDGRQRLFATFNYGMPIKQSGFVDMAVGLVHAFADSKDWKGENIVVTSPQDPNATLLHTAPTRHLVTRLDAAFWCGPRVLLGGRYSGMKAMSGASRSAAPGGVAIELPEENASSYSVGPIVTLRVDERCDVFAGSMHTISAKNTMKTNQVYGGLSFKLTKLDRLQGWLGGTRKP